MESTGGVINRQKAAEPVYQDTSIFNEESIIQQSPVPERDAVHTLTSQHKISHVFHIHQILKTIFEKNSF
jgi:hypothetical protein